MEMSKAERLNERVSELLTAAVQRVLEAVRDTVREYEEKSAQTQRENERLRRRVQELQDQLDRDTAGTRKVLAPPELDRRQHAPFSLSICGSLSEGFYIN